VLFDLEGTLVAGKRYEPLPGAIEILATLREWHIPFRIVTNNTTETPPDLLRCLSEALLPLAESELMTPLVVMRNLLSDPQRVFVIGSDAVKSVLKEDRHVIVDDESGATCIVVGGIPDPTIEQLNRATRALLAGAQGFIALHKNRLFQDANKYRVLGVGALVAAIEYATNRQATLVGKPNPKFFQSAIQSASCSGPDAMMIGDDPYADLHPAQEIGARTVLVTTGSELINLRRLC